MEHAVAQRGREREHEDADAADDAALRAAPAGHLAHAGEDVLEHGELRGERGEDHEQEEQRAPETAARHVVEHGGHRVEEQRRTGVDLEIVGKARGEHDQARHDGDERVEDDDVHALAHEGALLADIAAEDRHRADAEAQREERLVHRADDDTAVDLREIGHEVEGEAFLRAGERKAVDREHDHQDEQRRHQIFRHALQAALQIKAQNAEAQHDRDQQINDVHAGVRDHLHEAEVRALAEQELHEVIHHPAGDDGVERHQGDVAEQGKIAVDVPLLTGLLQLLIHAHGAGLRSAAHGELHRHCGQTQQQQAQDIHQHEAAAAVLTRHPRELPDVAAADRAARAQHDETEPAAQSLSVLIH